MSPGLAPGMPAWPPTARRLLVRAWLSGMPRWDDGGRILLRIGLGPKRGHTHLAAQFPACARRHRRSYRGNWWDPSVLRGNRGFIRPDRAGATDRGGVRSHPVSRTRPTARPPFWLCSISASFSPTILIGDALHREIDEIRRSGPLLSTTTSTHAGISAGVADRPSSGGQHHQRIPAGAGGSISTSNHTLVRGCLLGEQRQNQQRT